jgi:intracellular multiplication protein IcmT
MADNHWRNTQKHPKFFMLDARASIGVILFLMHMRLWTLIVAASRQRSSGFLSGILVFVLTQQPAP